MNLIKIKNDKRLDFISVLVFLVNIIKKFTLFGLSALLLETDKKKFLKLVETIKMNPDIKEKLERVIMDLNVDDELVTKYYDLEEERKKMYAAVLETKKERIQKEAHEEGIKEGIKEGIMKNKKDIVLNMYHENFSLDTISKATKLTISEINKLINENKES